MAEITYKLLAKAEATIEFKTSRKLTPEELEQILHENGFIHDSISLSRLEEEFSDILVYFSNDTYVDDTCTLLSETEENEND